VTRAVTFLLTDIEGSTAAWEAEADAMAVALARHDELVEQVTTSRGARLIKTRGEGDATSSVFERPSDTDDVTAYVAEAGYDDEELARAWASVTGGNPFFLIEALPHVDVSGGRWDPSTLPQGAREAVSRRLSRLSVETNKVLSAAAVVGSRFALYTVDGDLINRCELFDEADLDAALARFDELSRDASAS
jgi:hypothetical protein